MKTAVLLFALALAAITQTPGATLLCTRIVDAPLATGESPFYRTELYFGRSIPGGGSVSDAEWDDFLLTVVTPRFPDGFTVEDARGQYRQQDAKVITEETKVVIFLYSSRSRTASRRKIEEIRHAYVARFKQESVLRIDYPAVIDVRSK